MPTPLPPADDRVLIRDLETPDQLRAPAALYRQVFGRDDAVNPRLLTAIRGNGGVVLGAFDGADLVGFVYGFLGRDDPAGDAGATTAPELYHYSQTAAVRADQRGRGIGRLLKLAQRDRVLAQGIDRMRWAFDPNRTGNARFNLDVLGATARWFAGNLYGTDSVAGQPERDSDRLILDWDLPGSRDGLVPVRYPPVTTPPAWGTTAEDGDDLLLALPRTHADPLAATPSPEVTAAVSTVLREAIAAGYQAVSCLPSDDLTAVYRLRRTP
ncbi:GNAT family N-acetyltransferase [Nakamurella lactea]|uniref:GNAT family N-acetyltransferase n=1 Tax=Nakamurella lactea TaxID=459515 RepID=UPI0006878AD2|nr:GNAT family N-acetyltransferase [Nakamurella lactea]